MGVGEEGGSELKGVVEPIEEDGLQSHVAFVALELRDLFR